MSRQAVDQNTCFLYLMEVYVEYQRDGICYPAGADLIQRTPGRYTIASAFKNVVSTEDHAVKKHGCRWADRAPDVAMAKDVLKEYRRIRDENVAKQTAKKKAAKVASRVKPTIIAPANDKPHADGTAGVTMQLDAINFGLKAIGQQVNVMDEKLTKLLTIWEEKDDKQSVS